MRPECEKYIIFICAVVLTLFSTTARSHNVLVVADSVTRLPLSNASVFDRNGNLVGICSAKGLTPYISENNLPVVVRYMGYNEKKIGNMDSDTVFLSETSFQLPELVVSARQNKILHVLGYVREYSTLSTYTDTVFLYREKIVDFMLPNEKTRRFKGWSKPRIIQSRSYYRFTNAEGLDSVSDECDYHFSWSDWVGIVPEMDLPVLLREKEYGTDTLYGKYSPTEIWIKSPDKILIDVDVLADTASRKWVPNLSNFFRNNLDFEDFRVHLLYDGAVGNLIAPIDLKGFSYNIESRGRMREMFLFNRLNQPFFVSTYAEVYILDKEYITMKEARQWEKQSFDLDDIPVYDLVDAPPLQPDILALIDRVSNIDKDYIVLNNEPDPRIGYRNEFNNNFSFGNRVLSLLKGLTGISAHKFNRNTKKSWNNFRRERTKRNKDKKTTDRLE